MKRMSQISGQNSRIPLENFQRLLTIYYYLLSIVRKRITVQGTQLLGFSSHFVTNE